MEKYKKHIADSEEIELIHASLDHTDEAATKWATEDALPWLTILPSDLEKSGLGTLKDTVSVPEYLLIDAKGNTVVAGAPEGDAAFEKIKELTTKDKVEK